MDVTLNGIWHIAVLVLLISILFAIWPLPKRVLEEIEGKLNLDRVTENLKSIEVSAKAASGRVKRLDLRLKALARFEDQRAVMQTLFGTLVGLLGGFSASWVKEGGTFQDGELIRAAIVTVFGVLLVVLIPGFIFPRIYERLKKSGPDPGEQQPGE
ncbi:MAG: hypothetical protein QOF13_2188 [Solirubrobacterales bacterium]|jgi:hypothetical protein|nr:hypothetical protein [Solirubrobacterales bacterium]